MFSDTLRSGQRPDLPNQFVLIIICPRGSGLGAENEVFFPLRTRPNVSAAPTFVASSSFAKSSMVATFFPFKDSTRSPSFNPSSALGRVFPMTTVLSFCSRPIPNAGKNRGHPAFASALTIIIPPCETSFGSFFRKLTMRGWPSLRTPSLNSLPTGASS